MSSMVPMTDGDQVASTAPTISTPNSRRAELVQIGVVQTQLADERDEQTLPDDRLAIERTPRLLPEHHVGADADGRGDEDALACHQCHRSPVNALNEEVHLTPYP